MISGQTHLPISGLHPEAGKFHEEDAGISKEGSDVKQSANIDGVKASEEATSRIEATGDRSAGDLAGGDLAAGDGTARDQAANGEMASNDAAGEKNAAPVVLVDPRERDVARKLIALGVDVRMTALEVGDYVVSDRVGIERKTAVDFISSLVSPHRELFRQIGDLSRSYERPVMILEGRDLYSRQIHPNAVRGALSAIAVDYSVPIIPTYDQDETAAVIALLARREQSMPGNSAKAHGKKTARTLSEQQEYLISSIPSVGPAVAKNLLRHFGSIAAIMNASTEELMRVEKVGKKTALRIRELVGGQYKG
jgi:Fanconi anemia group M protein